MSIRRIGPSTPAKARSTEIPFSSDATNAKRFLPSSLFRFGAFSTIAASVDFRRDAGPGY